MPLQENLNNGSGYRAGEFMLAQEWTCLHGHHWPMASTDWPASESKLARNIGTDNETWWKHCPHCRHKTCSWQWVFL